MLIHSFMQGENGVRTFAPVGPRDRVAQHLLNKPPNQQLLELFWFQIDSAHNIDCLHRLCGVGVKDCTKPYGELIDRYPELFRSTPFMPVLGNHDREIRPRGPKPPAEPVYDIEATAFRKFFELPDDEWKWQFDVSDFSIRFVALDRNHISDMGTTWQTCHPFDKGSAQYRWYERLISGPLPPFVVTLYNERNASVRAQADGSWR